MLFYPIIQILMYEAAPEHKKGQYLGIYQAVFSSGNIHGPFFGSHIYHYFNAHYVWLGCGLMAMVIVLITCIIILMNKQLAHQTSIVI